MDFPRIIAFISEWLGVIAVVWLLSMNPRFQIQPIGFKYARRDGLIALSLFGVIWAFAFLYTSFSPPVFIAPLLPAPAPVTQPGYALVLAGVCLLPFLAALYIRKQPPRSAGWNPPMIRLGVQVGLAMALLTIFLRNRVFDVLRGMDSDSLLGLLMILGICLAEETIFRGYIQMRLSWWLGKWPGMALTAALFALWHLPAWMRGLPLETTMILFALTLAQGLVLGWLADRSGSVAAPALYRAISIWLTFFYP